jgi:putative ABC transport system permease protein
MADATNTTRFRFWIWLIRVIGVIVPRRLRADWRQEWEAELRNREMLLAEWAHLNWRTKLDLLRRSVGAFRDALLLQPRRMEDEMFQDLKFGWRVLARNKAFTFIAILTLAAGIGVNTAIFSAVNALLLRPLPYPEPDRLVWVDETFPQSTGRFVPGAHFLDWSEHSRTLAGIAAYGTEELTLTGASEPERLECYSVSASFFPTLGASPLLGRNFLPEEDRAGGERVAILSHSLWRRRFESDQGVIGRSIKLDDRSYRVVGVLPPDFRFFVHSELYIPLALDYAEEHSARMFTLLDVFARLKPGVTPEQATAEMDTISSVYVGAEQKKNKFFQGRPHLTPLHNHLAGETRRLLLILLGAVVLILLIACANVANLMLARGVVRQKELAIRAALGAGRLRLLRQMLTESLLLASGGGLCGLLIASGLTRLLSALGPSEAFGQVARLTAIDIDVRVLLFTMLASLLSGVFFGLVPALQLSRPDLNRSLKEGGRGGLSQRRRTRQALLVSEVALAVVLLVGAGLLIRSFVKLLNVEPGFRAENVLTARITLPRTRYQELAQLEQFQQRVLERVAALPGVESVGAINHLPLTDFNSGVTLRVEGRQNDKEGELPTMLGLVNSDYFRAMGISLRAGRHFDERDTGDSMRVVILSESLARRLFPNEDPLGKRVLMPGPRNDPPTVVGVVGDVRHEGLDREIKPQVYAPYHQWAPRHIILAIRSSVEPASLAAAVRASVRAVNPDLPLYDVMTMDERLAHSIAARRFTLMLLGAFALLALALAAVGVYGVISYAVTLRTHEVGVRMALGARSSDVLRLFIRQGMALALCGVAIGLLGALALTRVMTALLFDVGATDPLTFALAPAMLTLVALAACWLPARRAMRVDPMVALRCE